jgi:arylsulfatase
MDTYEGGVITPLIAHWPAGIAARGGLRHTPGHIIDVMPTLVELAGVEYPAERAGTSVLPMEGKSLVPIFAADPSDVPPRPLFWEHIGNRAVRMGSWKAVAPHGAAWELYDLAADPTETRNVAQDHADRLRGMTSSWQAWADRCEVHDWDALQELRGSRKKPRPSRD